MAYALYQAKEAKILIENPKLEFQSGKYRYVVERRGGETVYQVTEGMAPPGRPMCLSTRGSGTKAG
jgi:hypothetical protein